MRTRLILIMFLVMGCVMLTPLAFAGTVDATSVTYQLTTSNSGSGLPTTGNFGSVTLTLGTSGTINVTVQMTSPYTFVYPDGNDISINGAASGTSFSNVVGTSASAFPIYLTATSTSGNVSTWGNFSLILNHLTVDCTQYPKNQCPSGQQMTTVTFVLSNPNHQFTVADLANFSFAIHLGSKGVTGYVKTGPPSITTPEPATLTLFGTGMLMAGRLLRKKFRKA